MSNHSVSLTIEQLVPSRPFLAQSMFVPSIAVSAPPYIFGCEVNCWPVLPLLTQSDFM